MHILKVHQTVSAAVIKALKPGTSVMEDCKQMPRSSSCMTKDLYFFPCPGGKGGEYWPSVQ